VVEIPVHVVDDQQASGRELRHRLERARRAVLPVDEAEVELTVGELVDHANVRRRGRIVSRRG